MTALDYVVIAIAAFSTFAGWRRGVLSGVFTLASAFLGIVLAAHLCLPVSGFLAGITTTQRAAELLSFALVFVATLAAGAFTSYRLRRALRRARLGGLDHGLGAAAGLLRAWLVCSAIYLGLTAFRVDAVQGAFFAPALVEGTKMLSYLGSDDLRRRFAAGYDALDRAWVEERGRR